VYLSLPDLSGGFKQEEAELQLTSTRTTEDEDDGDFRIVEDHTRR